MSSGRTPMIPLKGLRLQGHRLAKVPQVTAAKRLIADRMWGARVRIRC